MVLYGTTHCVGDGVTTGDILAPAYYADDPAVLAAHCLEGVDPALAERLQPGDILLAGKDFGNGQDAEMAVLALQALGIAVVLCHSVDEAFQELAHTYGLPVLVSAEAGQIPSETVVRVDLEHGRATDRATKHSYRFSPAAPPLIAAVRRSQLLTRMRQVVEEEGFDG